MGPASYPPRQSPQDVVNELVEAIRLTVEYVGTNMLPPIEGWSWYDALKKHAPDIAQQFEKEYEERQEQARQYFDQARPKHIQLTGFMENSLPYLVESDDGSNWTEREFNKEPNGYSVTVYKKHYDVRFRDISVKPKEQTDEHQ